MVNMKKQGMAEAAEQLLAGTGWLPAPLCERREPSKRPLSPRRRML
jgi:hypothetical protein